MPDPAVSGILVQLPLPPQIDASRIIATVDPDKDVDGFHPLNAGRLASGLPGLAPCTPLGCIKLAKTVHSSLAGMDAVVIGRSNIVGKPLAQLTSRRERDGDDRAFAHARSSGAVPPCRSVVCGHRPAGNGARRLDQAGRNGDRRRHQSHSPARRQVASGWRCEFRRSCCGRRRDYAGAGRRRPDDDCVPAGRIRCAPLACRRDCRRRVFDQA